jgi:signal transduction histidine kinase/DNA-binding NarL/FixJ family response regulator
MKGAERTMASILVVEDELVVAMDLESTLKELGYTVTAIVPSGELAIEAAARERPDLVLMDIQLQGRLDGATTALLLRQVFKVPVVVLSGCADPASIERAKLSEPFAYLLKPFEERELHSAIDLALHKHATELRLEQSRREMDEIVQRIPDAVAILRGETILFVNAAWIAAMGPGDPSEYVGQPIGMFLDAAERDTALTWLLGSAADETAPAPRELRLRRRSGEPVLLEVVPVQLGQYQGGRALLVLGRDVTTRKQLQARLALADRLVAVGTIAAGVAHEMNNPLSYVISNIELCAEEVADLAFKLERSDEPSRMPDGASEEIARRLRGLRRNLDDALSGAGRVAAIVRDLVTFSRASADRRLPVDLPKLLGAMARLLWNEIRHRARLVEDYAEAPAVDASEDQLGQVFLNILLNAAQAIAPGHAEGNEVRIATRADASGRAVVEISDTGCGIPPDVLPRIFDPFFTTKPVGSGTGLGLSICHGVVTSLGGLVEVESEPGRGSLFRVVLPAARLQAVAPPPVPARDRPSRRGRVLVVDDEPLLLSLFERLLGVHHDLAGETDARVALERVERGERFDAILCDLMMPEMSGMDLYDAIAESAPEQAERMIFLTGGAFTAPARAFLERVSNPRFMKPFNLRQLIELVASKVD